MTTIKAIRLASAVTAINVLVAIGYSIAAIINPQYLVPGAVPTEASLLLAMYAAAPRIPLAFLVLGAVYKHAGPALCSWVRSPGPCNCWMPESGCMITILGNALGRSLAGALGYFVGHCKNLVGVFIEQKMVITEVTASHVPMEILRLHVEAEHVCQQLPQSIRDFRNGLVAQVGPGL